MGTMLVPLTPDAGRREAGRPLAAFVAQLIACEAGLGGHRQRRRAAPGEASSLYQARQAGGIPAARAERRA